MLINFCKSMWQGTFSWWKSGCSWLLSFYWYVISNNSPHPTPFNIHSSINMLWNHQIDLLDLLKVYVCVDHLHHSWIMLLIRFQLPNLGCIFHDFCPFFTSAGALYLHFATSVIHEITTALGIYCFRWERNFLATASVN